MSDCSVVGCMARPRHCINRACPNARSPGPKWCARDGTYTTVAHGTVQRYRCRACGARPSGQSESLHYFAKLRLDLRSIFTRLRGGSSMRDIARSEHCSPNAIASAVLRVGRQAMAAHLDLMLGLEHPGRLCFDGLVSAVCSRDYPSQITTLADRKTELVLAMTHAVTERGGTRSEAQRRRIERRRRVWHPEARTLRSSITLLVNELPRFAGPTGLLLDTDEHPLYPNALARDAAIRWFARGRMFTHRRTPGIAPRTTENPLFVVNYLDRMIRHRVKEHTRESIAIARNATMQMHRMWIFGWDHNAVQPRRVAGTGQRSRAEMVPGASAAVRRLKRHFFTRRIAVRSSMPESMRVVWTAQLATPPVRWRARRSQQALRIPGYAIRDLEAGDLHGW